MPNVIETLDLSFRYGSEPLFSRVNFAVSQGDFVAIIGANGTGKSTLLKLLLGELTPTEGAIRLFGQDLRQFRDWPKVGYVPQAAAANTAGFPATADEIVMASLYPQVGLMRFARKRHRELARQALERVGMAGFSRRLIGEMSGGQQQRVMLARVLAGAPEVMLLDEPTTGVDAATVETLFQLLADLNREIGLTIVMVTHDIGRASRYVTRTLCLEEGSMVELGPAQVHEELAHKHKHPHHSHSGEGDGHGHAGI